MRDLERRTHVLNELMRRRLELEAALRMWRPEWALKRTQEVKRELVAVNARIARLEARLK